MTIRGLRILPTQTSTLLHFTMTVQTFDDGGYVVTGDSIPTYRLLTLRTALKMETKGLRVSSHRPSAYSIIKKEFGLKLSLIHI